MMPFNFAATQGQHAVLSGQAVLAGQMPEGVSQALAAVALFNDSSIETNEIYLRAEERVAGRQPRHYAFSPLYTTNHCDSHCKMCAMRKGNLLLDRKFAGRKVIEEQLRILRDSEHLRGLGLLTGEYADPFSRLANAFRIGWATRTALDMGFKRIYLNIGTMTPDEIEVLAEWINPDEPVTLCVFQETFNRETYRKFMGLSERETTATTTAELKSDFDQRIASFDHWLQAGFKDINQGVLVGLAKNPVEEMFNLLAHAEQLEAKGANVSLSLPRLRPANGASRNASGVDDDYYLRMLATIAFICPQYRLILTTREDEAFQKRALGLCGVFSPGSPDVAPYVADGPFSNDARSSQFLIPDQRRPSEVLQAAEKLGYRFEHFENPERASLPSHFVS